MTSPLCYILKNVWGHKHRWGGEKEGGAGRGEERESWDAEIKKQRNRKKIHKELKTK